MGNEEIKKWSNQMFKEIKELEHKKFRMLDRCCRASINGAVEIKDYNDKILMQPYKPKLIYCPECGKKLIKDDE
jgi:hypothetical protein